MNKSANRGNLLLIISVCTLLRTSISVTQTLIDSSLVGIKISSIQIQGNEKTKPHIILREMKQKIGDLLDPDLLREDQKRIQSLFLFNQVIILTEPAGEDVRLRVIVTEQWYLFPYPIFFINERDWSKLSYGAGLTHLNFRGRAEILMFKFWLGYNPAIHLDYANPWFGGKRNLFTQVNFFYDRIRSKHFVDKDVTENHLGLRWILGKRFGYHAFFSFILGYKEITFSPSAPAKTLSPDGKDRLPQMGLLINWDNRDLKEYAHSGWLVNLHTLKTGLPSLAADYLRYSFDIRKYFPISTGWTLAFRTKADLSYGKIPLYDRVYLGYNERIRGHFFETFEGENMALASVALRFPLLPIRYFDLSDYPQLSNLKFGISLGFFADTGLTWFQRERIKQTMLQSGVGFGLHIHLPYIHLLRFELAFDEKGKGQLILDLYADI